jgi:hypothetical protein
MGVVGTVMNLSIRRFNVLKKGDRYGSLNEDGVHLNGMRGTFTFEDSVLEGMGDDGLNIHNQNSEIINIVNSTTIEVSAVNYQTKLFFSPGTSSTQQHVLACWVKRSSSIWSLFSWVLVGRRDLVLAS